MKKKMEKVRAQVPVDVDVHISQELFANALRTSKLFWEVIKPRLDLSEFLESFMEDPKDFYRWFYTEENLSLEKLIEKIRGK